MNKVKIIVNGNWIGVVDDPINIYKYMKNKKYKGIINIYTSIVFDYKTRNIYINNDAGRITETSL